MIVFRVSLFLNLFFYLVWWIIISYHLFCVKQSVPYMICVKSICIFPSTGNCFCRQVKALLIGCGVLDFFGTLWQSAHCLCVLYSIIPRECRAEKFDQSKINIVWIFLFPNCCFLLILNISQEACIILLLEFIIALIYYGCLHEMNLNISLTWRFIKDNIAREPSFRFGGYLIVR